MFYSNYRNTSISLVLACLFMLIPGQTFAQIDISKPVGSTQGVANVTTTGSGSYTVPIEIPPGTNGMVPKISLSYNSIAGPGIAGMGWKLDGISTITRKGKTNYHTGLTTPVSYENSNDGFFLDGMRLFPVTGNNGENNTIYGTEMDNYAKIQSFASAGFVGPEWFLVTLKDGTRLTYGSSVDSRVLTEGNAVGSQKAVMVWYLKRVIDLRENYYEFSYNNDFNGRTILPSRVSYTGSQTGLLSTYNYVDFKYESRPDDVTLYEGGFKTVSNSRLTAIEVYTEGILNRKYSLTYQLKQNQSYLEKITESGSDGVALNPLVFDYGNKVIADDVKVLPSFPFLPSQDCITGDFNGDGKVDILAAEYTITNNIRNHKNYTIYDNFGAFGTTGTVSKLYSYTAPILEYEITHRNTAKNFRFLGQDYDNDGKDDVIMVKGAKEGSGSATKRVFVNVTINHTRIYTPSSGWTYLTKTYSQVPQMLTYPSPCKYMHESGNYFLPGDFDGDGSQDYILILGVTSTDGFGAFFSSPAKGIFNSEIWNFGVGGTTTFYANTVASAQKIIPVDMDGDGRTELLVLNGPNTYILRVMPIPSTSGYSYGASYAATDNLLQWWHHIYPGDFNGDGKTDLLWRNSGTTATPDWKILYSNGKVFGNPNPLPLVHTPILPGDGGNVNAHHLIVADLNGDGKSDVLHALDLSAFQSKYVAYFSDGNGFAVESYTMSGSVNGEAAVAAEINGDGKADFVSYKGQVGTIAMLKPEREERYLSKITNGIGHVTEFSYRTLRPQLVASNYLRSVAYEYANQNETTGGSHLYPYPYNVLCSPIYAVFSIRTPDGIGGQAGTNYYYEDMMYHPAGRGILGFRKMTSDRWTENLKEVATYDINTQFFIPFAKSSLVTDGSNSKMTELQQEYTFTKVNTNYADKRFYSQVNKTKKIDYLQDVATESVNTYDIYGNPTTIVTQTGPYNVTTLTPLETRTVTTVYGQYGTPVPISPESITVQSLRTGEPQVNKVTTITYNTNNTIATHKEFSGTAKQIVTTHAYSTLGALTQSTVSATGLPTKTIQLVYDPKERYVIEEKKLASGVTQKAKFTYHSLWGKVVTSTSSDGLATTYDYDAYGRVNSETKPEGYIITYSLYWPHIAGVYALATSRPGGGPDTKHYYDVLSRVVREETSGLNNNWTAATYTYNTRGQLSMHANAAFPSETGRTISYFYDNFGRNNSITSPEGSTGIIFQKLTGGQLKVTTTNPAGHSTSQTTDAAGRTISTTDNGGQLNFLYDSWGNQRNVSYGSYNLVTNTYDIYGRLATSVDKNAGTTSYEYNAYGELFKSQDALGNLSTMVYDALGRLVTRTAPEGTTSYTYFNESGTGYSNNNLTSITSFNGTNETYTYDNLRRIKTHAKIIDGTTQSYQFEYDAYGNQSKITYPSGTAVDFVYDKNGHLTNVTNSQFGTLFTAQAMNSLGVYTSYTLGNTKSSTLTYDVDKKHPKRYNTPGVMDMNWVFDAASGNLSSRKDALLNLTETFTYDNLDRLLTTKLNNVQQQVLTYDNSGGLSMGNIKTKTDAGNYVYNDQKIHALAYVTNPTGAQTPPSVIPTLQQDVTYTQFGKTNTVTENNNVMTLTYDASYDRVKSEMKVGGALGERRTYFGIYEKRLDPNGDIEEVHYVPGGNDYCAAIVRKNGSSKIYYLYTDFQGSILAATDNTGIVVARQNFDAWGRRRNPSTWLYSSVPAVPTWLMRGYTGQEHLNSFGLINLNGRMYDPVLGRMLSPDPHIIGKFSSQGYNRYQYALNNPLVFVDKDGEFPWHIVIGAAIGGVVNVVTHWDKIGGSWEKGLAAFGVGAAAGAVAAVTGQYTVVALGGTAAASSSVAAGIAYGGISGAAGAGAGSIIQGTGNAILFQEPYTLNKFVSDTKMGFFGGSVLGGASSKLNGAPWINTNGGNKVDVLYYEMVFPNGGGRYSVQMNQTVKATGSPTGASGGGIVGLSRRISAQKQARHIAGTAPEGKGYLNNLEDAQTVLNAVHSGEATFLGVTNAGHQIYRFNGVTGINVNLGAGITAQPTNVFMIKGTISPSVVPTNPNW